MCHMYRMFVHLQWGRWQADSSEQPWSEKRCEQWPLWCCPWGFLSMNSNTYHNDPVGTESPLVGTDVTNPALLSSCDHGYHCDTYKNSRKLL